MIGDDGDEQMVENVVDNGDEYLGFSIYYWILPYSVHDLDD